MSELVAEPTRERIHERRLKIGILGSGAIADFHVEGILSAFKGTEISVCDQLPGKAELLRRKYNLSHSYVSLEEMLEKEKPFSVHVCTPPQYHVAHAITCLEAGCHVLVEKPFSFRAQDAARAFEVARRENRTLAVNHSILFQPCVATLFDHLRSWHGAKIISVISYFGIDTTNSSPAAMPHEHWKRQLLGGTAVDTIIHPITLAVRLTGAPRDISVVFSGSPWEPDELLVAWKGAAGIGSVMVSTKGHPFRRTTEVTTDKGSILIDHSTEVTVPMGMGVGPKALRKIQRNMNLGFGMIGGTMRSVWRVARKKIKENPGVRLHVADFYKGLLSNESASVTRENVLDATEILARIAEELQAAGVLTSADPVGRGSPRTPAAGVPLRKVLLTGASGLLGGELCECLADGRRAVRAQVRRSANADRLAGRNLERLYLDFGKGPVDYGGLVADAEEILHCAHSAGAVTWDQFRTVNVDASVALYRAARAAGCKKFVFVSSVAVYGVRDRRPNVVNEETGTVPGDSRYDFYVKSKTIAERELIKLAKEGGPPLLIIRPGILYAADGKRLLKRAIPLRDARLVLAFGSGKNHLPYTRVDAVARTICAALDRDPFPTGVYQLTGSSEESAREFLIKRTGKLGIRCRFVSIPVFPLRLLALGTETLYGLLRRSRPPKLTRYVLDSATRNLRYDCSKAERDLGWSGAEATAI